MSSRRHLRRGLAPGLAVFLVATLLLPLPVLAQTAPDDSSAPVASTPADDPLDPPDLGEPLSEQDRIPVLAEDDLAGIPIDEIQPAIPGDQNITSFEDIFDQLEPLTDESNAYTDAYGTGPEAASHVAVIYADKVNGAAGRDLDLDLTPTDQGFTAETTGYTATLPDALGAGRAVTVEILRGLCRWRSPVPKPKASSMARRSPTQEPFTAPTSITAPPPAGSRSSCTC